MIQVLASMSEIIRVGGWALRGVGFPFGVAERGTRLLAWTEAVHGGAIADICAYDATIGQNGRPGEYRFDRAPDGGWLIDAAGRHLLELGPPAADLVTSDARLNGVGSASIQKAVGFVFATALSSVLAERGLLALCVYRAPKAEAAQSNYPKRQWILSGPGHAGSRFASGVPGDALSVELANVMQRPNFFGADDQIVDNEDGGFLQLKAWKPGQDDWDKIASAWQRCHVAGAEKDYSARLSDVYRQGLTMPLAHLQELYELEIRTWAPTSERSRSQAGYGAYRPS